MSNINSTEKRSTGKVGCGLVLIIIAVVGGAQELIKPSTATTSARSDINAILNDTSRPLANVTTIVTMAILLVIGLGLILSKERK